MKDTQETLVLIDDGTAGRPAGAIRLRPSGDLAFFGDCSTAVDLMAAAIRPLHRGPVLGRTQHIATLNESQPFSR